MSAHRRLASLALAAIALIGAGCGGGTAAAPHDARAIARQVAAVRRHLPPGFEVAEHAAPPAGVAVLNTAPASDIRASDLHLAAAPAQGPLPAVVAAVIDQPAAITVGRLLVSSYQLRPRERITVAAAGLPASQHVVLFILQGPSYRAEHLVAASSGATAAVVTLPPAMATGTWYLAVQDLSQLHAVAPHTLAGVAFVDIGMFTVR